MVLLAGPNGAGKSTLYETRIKPQLAVPFINADDIQRTRLGTTDMQAAYKAAKIATKLRARYLLTKRSFATETVFSHPSKLDLLHRARERGFRILLMHVGVQSAALSVARVAARVQEGGHPVPQDKIIARYDRNGPLIRQAALLADVAHVYDNSALNTPPARMLSFKAGALSFALPHLPEWVLRIYGEDLRI